MDYRVSDVSLAKEGKIKIDWAEAHMPVLSALREKYGKTRPLEGIRVGGCLHVTKETGVLVRTLKTAGAEISWCGCNPLSTQDDVAASLVKDESVSVFASRGVATTQYYEDIHSVMRFQPNITVDDGADLIVEMHKNINKIKSVIRGGTEETTT
jgi:adenosylhomocysteinase